MTNNTNDQPVAAVPVETLKWWRELAAMNPADLVPRIDAMIAAAAAAADDANAPAADFGAFDMVTARAEGFRAGQAAAARELAPTPMTDEGCAFRMDAYYYGFVCTGVYAIDLILSAVACAGKAFHHTEDWNDSSGPWHGLLRGNSPVEWIQNAAADAAAHFRAAPADGSADRAAYEGAREDLLDWKRRAQRAEAELRRIGYTGVTADEPPAVLLDEDSDHARIEFIGRERIELSPIEGGGWDALRYGEGGQADTIANGPTPRAAIDAARFIKSEDLADA